MGIIIGYIVRLITFPGLILDAFVNKKLCDFLKLEVQKVNYFALDAKELPVVHEIPKKYIDTFSIAILPFIIMSFISATLFYIGLQSSPEIEILFMWLGISIAAHSFPNTVIGKLLWINSISEIKGGNYLAIIGIPLVIIIYIARILHVLWLDVIYGIGLYILIRNNF